MIDKENKKDNIELDYRYSLIAGAPIKVENVGKVHPLTLREIGEIGESEYNKYVSFLTLDKSLLQNKKIDMNKVSNYDIVTNNCRFDDDFKTDIELALSIFLREQVVFVPEYNIFVVGEVKEKRFIHQENFDTIVNIVKKQNMIERKVTEQPNANMSEKAKRLMQKRNKGRNLLKQARGENDIGLADLISSLGVYTLNINNVLDWTVYQFHDQYKRFVKQENYKNNFEMYLVGADPKKLNLGKHWTSK